MPDHSLSRQSTLVERAAKYFGRDDWEVMAIRCNNTECLLVAPQPSTGKTIVMHYSEDFGRPRGTFIKLTDRALAQLIETLEGIYDAV